MPTHQTGRRQFGQNFLTDQTVIQSIVDHVAKTKGSIVEIGSGKGALTFPLIRLQRPLTAVELDTRLARRLAQHLGSEADVVNTDFLRYRLPRTQHVLVGNVPFHLTTAILRHVLGAPGWTDAVLIVQWEVARRRAGVGGSSMLTAQWSPWFTFELGRRIPARAFQPRPSVDAGLLLVGRRSEPLLSRRHQKCFQSLVDRIFTGRGRGLAQILSKAGVFTGLGEARQWLQTHQISEATLPKELSLVRWVDLYRAVQSSPARRR